MAGPVQERVTDADKRHFDFIDALLGISEALTEKETANVKLYCMHLIPKGQLAQHTRAVDVFHKLIELDKIDQENLDFVEEILERMGRRDLIRDVLRPFQPPDRDIPENPDLQPGTSDGSENTEAREGTIMSNIYVIVHGPVRMIQETLDHLKNNLASLCRTRRAQVMFRGYRRVRSILVHFSIPRGNTAVLRLMAEHSDPRLVYMGVKSLQIDAEPPIEVTQSQAALLFDVKRQLPADDIEVGCSTRMTQQRAPKNWTRLSALNLFSDALPLHLQIAESLEYQGFSFILVQALAEKEKLREQEMGQRIQNLLTKTEEDSNTLMTTRSKLNIEENRSKEALETIIVLEEKLQQAQEYAEKAAKQVASRVTEYTGEKPPGGWSAQIKKTDVATLAGEKKETIPYGGSQSGSEVGNFRSPVCGVCVVMSPSNEIFVVDKGNSRVQVHNTKGVYLRDFRTVVPGTDEKANKLTPHDVSMDANGTLWVVGEGESADYIVQYSKEGRATEKIKLPEPALYVRGIVVDTRNNHILVTEPSGDRGEIQVFRPDGSLVRKFGHPGMRVPDCIKVDGEGNKFVSDWFTRSVYMYDESGKFLRTEVWR
ncbi:uncharacterized protein [Branchiostoma lanceolatum]|uniref:uncharacterized protein n=1 Tax=Branchiostoma lanceolatum TaxID=7740 RepID=UPI003455C6AA